MLSRANGVPIWPRVAHVWRITGGSFQPKAMKSSPAAQESTSGLVTMAPNIRRAAWPAPGVHRTSCQQYDDGDEVVDGNQEGDRQDGKRVATGHRLAAGRDQRKQDYRQPDIGQVAAIRALDERTD